MWFNRHRCLALLMAVIMLFSTGCSLFGRNGEQTEDTQLPDLAQGKLTEEEVLALLGGTAYIPLEMDGEQAYRVVEDFLYLQYFTPSPFYTSQSPNAFNMLLEQRDGEAYALGSTLENDVKELLERYISLGKATAAVLNELAEGYNGQEEYSRDWELYVSLHNNLSREMNYYLYNTNAYLTTAAQWREMAELDVAPFRKAQVEYFYMLHSMRAALELLEGFERVAIQARGLTVVLPGTSGEGELLQMLESLSGDERIPRLAANTTALLHGIADAYEGNRQQALAILGERMHASRTPGEEAWAEMDALCYKLLDIGQQQDGINSALPEHLRPVSMAYFEPASVTSAATNLVSTPLEETAEEHLAILGEAYDDFWSEQMEEVAGQLAQQGKEDGILLLWQTFAADLREDDRLVEVLERPRPMDAVIPAAAAVDLYEVVWEGYLEERELAPLLAGEFDGIGSIVSQSGLMLSALLEFAQVVAPTGAAEAPAAVPLVYTPQPAEPRVENMAALRFYVDGVVVTDLCQLGMINLVKGSIPLDSEVAGLDYAASIAAVLTAENYVNLSDLLTLDLLDAVMELELKSLVSDLARWMDAMLAKYDNLLLFNIDVVLDLSDSIDPDPPHTVGVDSSSFGDYLAQSQELLSMEILRYIDWSGTMTLVGMDVNDYELLYEAYMERDEIEPAFARYGVTYYTREMAEAHYQILRDAVAANDSFPATITVRTAGELEEFWNDKDWEVETALTGRTPDDPEWEFVPQYQELDFSPTMTVYVEELRGNLVIYSGVGRRKWTASYNHLSFKNGAYRVPHLRNIYLLPIYDDATGEFRLTGGYSDRYNEDNGGEFTLHWRLDMTGTYTDPDLGAMGPEDPIEPPIDVIGCGPIELGGDWGPIEGPGDDIICILWEPNDDEEEKEEDKKPEDPKDPVDDDEEPTGQIIVEPEPNYTIYVGIQGHWEGSAIISNSYGETEFKQEKVAELREADKMVNEQYNYLEQLLDWQRVDRGIGVRRAMTLDLLQDQEGHMNLGMAVAYREGRPETDFSLRAVDRSNSRRHISTGRRRFIVTTSFSVYEETTWESYSLTLYPRLANGRVVMTGTMHCTSPLTGRTIVYDVFLEKTDGVVLTNPAEEADGPDDPEAEKEGLELILDQSLSGENNSGLGREDADENESIPDDGQEEES